MEAVKNNSPGAVTLTISTKGEADLLAELVEKCQVAGPHARNLANLYDKAQVIKRQFADVDGAK